MLRSMEVRELDQRAGLDGLFALIREVGGFTGAIFRGQSNSSWELVPGLYRQKYNFTVDKAPGMVETAFNVLELKIANRFFKDGHPYVQTASRSTRNDLSLMQHFGCPTRLLDWTKDPLVGLFFALSSQDAETDAALYVLVPSFSSEAAILDAPYPEGLPNFRSIVTIHPTPIDARVVAQKSVFTLQPFGDDEEQFTPLDRRRILRPDKMLGSHPEEQATEFTKIIIPAKSRFSLMATLLYMGIDHASLFPDLQGVGSAISHSISFWGNV